jgi:hypothetical protein
MQILNNLNISVDLSMFRKSVAVFSIQKGDHNNGGIGKVGFSSSGFASPLSYKSREEKLEAMKKAE